MRSDEIDQLYLAHHMAVSAKAGDIKDPDFMFLRRLLPTTKQLGPVINLEFKGSVPALLQEKLRGQSISYPPRVPSSIPPFLIIPGPHNYCQMKLRGFVNSHPSPQDRNSKNLLIARNTLGFSH